MIVWLLKWSVMNIVMQNIDYIFSMNLVTDAAEVEKSMKSCEFVFHQILRVKSLSN